MNETMSFCAELPKNIQVTGANGIYKTIQQMPPRNRRDLKNYVKVFLGIDVPDVQVCCEHSSPMDYLWHGFAFDLALRNQKNVPRGNADCIVWANRGGGKTELAAVATLLDGLFKPNCQIRILGGSGEQSGRMYEYLTTFLQHGFEDALAGPIRKDRCRFTNGAGVELLTQSARSVRGQHVQKLRCDEVELFDEEVFAAAKFTTLSTPEITAGMELISTMHRPYGIMQREVAAARTGDTPVFKWCLWETIAQCVDRNCSQCPLWGDCRGRARQAAGYLSIDDCITQMRRSSRAGWESEMLCIRPSLENVVFGEFDPDVHVRPIEYNPNLPLYRALDFGFVNPFVCLWIQPNSEGKIHIIDEYVRSRATIDVHAEQLKVQTPCAEEQVAATFCDPAGAGSNDITGTSVVRELRTMGIPTRYRRSGIIEGIELIRRAIRSGDGRSHLIISPRCQRLIEAMQCYHYPDSSHAATGELPLKDGLYDHPIDALRYFFANYRQSTKATSRRY